MSINIYPPKSPTPCGEYFGNVCSGFGGVTICYVCGWDMGYHTQYTYTEWPTEWTVDYHRDDCEVCKDAED